MITEPFLAPYRELRDPFHSLLARSTFLGKYSRAGESWTDTIARVVNGSVALDSNVTQQEAEKLFDIFWTMKALPPGRGLWTGGVPNIPVEARNNCYHDTLRHYDDWCWVADMLMCGGGVGVSLHSINQLPVVEPSSARLFLLCSKSHANVEEVLPDSFVSNPSDAEWVIVDDSRKGWIEALRSMLKAGFEGRSLVVNLSSIRRRGSPIKTFGGIACGPGPLANLLRQVWSILSRARGRKLNSVECLDITNHIGVCIKSGNVRRSALIVLGKSDDQAFRDAKKDWNAVMTHRHSSNNSIVFETESQIDAFNWDALIEDNAVYGEPGILNLWKARQTDPGAMGVNPCGEQILHDREACNLSEVFIARIPPKEVKDVLRLVTRYTLRQRVESLVDPQADSVRKSNMRIGVGLGGVCDFDWDERDLQTWYRSVRVEADRYADELGVSKPIACTTVKPSGTISLLNGSSPGMHAPFASHYIRRTRIGKDEPMAQALVEAGVPHENCIYDSSGKTWVFSFPTEAPHEGVAVQTETAKDQIERQLKLQRSWSDNAVSCTISFVEHEKKELASLLKAHVKDLKSISCLPKAHGYEQPPYQVITEDEYRAMHSRINHEHPLTAGGELDTLECQGDVCPVR